MEHVVLRWFAFPVRRVLQVSLLAVSAFVLLVACGGGSGGSGSTPTERLTVEVTGSGTITSSPAGIDCGDTCTYRFTENASVTLTAVPENENHLVTWTGCGSATATTCTVTMNEAKTISVVIEAPGGSIPQMATLTVEPTGTGSGVVTSDIGEINCGENCEAMLLPGFNVTLTAEASLGSAFVGWSEEQCSVVAGNACTIAVRDSATVTPQFDFVPERLTVTKIGSGSGTVTTQDGSIDCGSDCMEDIGEGLIATLVATPAQGSHFVSWSGCDVSNGPTGSDPSTCVVTVDSGTVVTAQFLPNADYATTYLDAFTSCGSCIGRPILLSADGTDIPSASPPSFTDEFITNEDTTWAGISFVVSAADHTISSVDFVLSTSATCIENSASTPAGFRYALVCDEEIEFGDSNTPALTMDYSRTGSGTNDEATFEMFSNVRLLPLEGGWLDAGTGLEVPQ